MTTAPGPRPPGGIVLVGGSGQRLGGVDKGALRVDGRTLLDRALEALEQCDPVVVVGASSSVPPSVKQTSEEPAGGGPVAGLLAGLDVVANDGPWVAVLAVDMPHVTQGTFDRLMAAARDDGAVLVDNSGRRQYLCAVYRQAGVRAAAESAGDPHGMSMRRLVERLRLAEVAAVGREPSDVDTPEDLALVDEDTRPIAFDDR